MWYKYIGFFTGYRVVWESVIIIPITNNEKYGHSIRFFAIRPFFRKELQSNKRVNCNYNQRRRISPTLITVYTKCNIMCSYCEI
jgi:hypothetical protein